MEISGFFMLRHRVTSHIAVFFQDRLIYYCSRRNFTILSQTWLIKDPDNMR
jgi:hypothetical protein